MPRVAILDDYQNVARDYADWRTLEHRAELSFFHDTPIDELALVARLAPFEIIGCMRERTPFPRSLVAQLPNLKMLVSTGMRNRAFDMAALRDYGVVVTGTPSSYETTTELTWALLLALARNLVAENKICIQAVGRARLASACAPACWASSGLARSAQRWQRSASYLE